MGQRPRQGHDRWLDHRHYRTYEIALGITRAVGPSGDLRDLESLALGITAFLSSWQKETAVHKFARFIADDMFLEDTQGRYIQVYEHGSSIATLRGISLEALAEELGEAGVVPAERPTAWAAPADLPDAHVDLAVLDEDLGAADDDSQDTAAPRNDR